MQPIGFPAHRVLLHLYVHIDCDDAPISKRFRYQGDRVSGLTLSSRAAASMGRRDERLSIFSSCFSRSVAAAGSCHHQHSNISVRCSYRVISCSFSPVGRAGGRREKKQNKKTKSRNRIRGGHIFPIGLCVYSVNGWPESNSFNSSSKVKGRGEMPKKIKIKNEEGGRRGERKEKKKKGMTNHARLFFFTVTPPSLRF